MTDIRDEVAAALSEQGVTLDDIEARLASGYAEFKQPLMVAVADVSALVGAARRLTVVREGELDVERLQTAMQNVGYTIEDDMNMETRAMIRPLRWFQAPDIAAEYAALTRQPECGIK